MRQPLDLIVCPICRGELKRERHGLLCAGCGRRYRDGATLDLTPVPPPDADVLASWPLWEKLQANFVSAASAVPEHSLSVTSRPDVEAFASFCAFSGIVLDVGCGTQRLPTYADRGSCRFVGIDPLAGEPERAFEFVQGIGEYLPFRSDSLDQVLFATSLDHMLVPRRALAEARRVIRAGGSVNVWFGELDREAHAGALRRLRNRTGGLVDRVAGALRGDRSDPVEPEYLAALDRPEGAADKFHVAHPTAEGITETFGQVGLELTDVERIEFASGCFVRGTK
jgi:ubiquinone/menaquinone biosynthesis C-methylase UbiE